MHGSRIVNRSVKYSTATFLNGRKRKNQFAGRLRDGRVISIQHSFEFIRDESAQFSCLHGDYIFKCMNVKKKMGGLTD